MSAPSSRPRSTTLGWSRAISPSTTLLLVVATERSILLSIFGHASSLTFPSSPGNPLDSLTRGGFLGEIPPPQEAIQLSVAQAHHFPLADPMEGIIWESRKHRPDHFIASLRGRQVNFNPFKIDHIGLNMAGPIKIWFPHAGRPRDLIAGTVAFLADLKIRAVRLQLREGLDFESFKPGCHVFLATKGLPSEIYSDNKGKTLSSKAWIRGLLGNDDDEYFRELDPQLDTKWFRNHPETPCWGGERGRC